MLNVQIVVTNNKLIGEKVASARLVNQQNMSFDDFCEHIAEGSTVTSADVSAVMKRIETLLPMLLALNVKITASPAGLIFRPTVKGSLTQSQLKEKLSAKKAEYIAAGDIESADKIDVNRELKSSDLAISELSPFIEVTLPSKWSTNFKQTAEFKRVTKVSSNGTETEEEDPGSGGSTPGGSGGQGGGSVTPPPSGGGGSSSDDDDIE